MARRFGVRMVAPAGWMLGCGCLLSCSAIFGIDASDRRDESELGGAGGADPGSGGRSTGGRSTGGDASGGRAGNGGAGGGGAGGNQSGTGGETPGGAGGEGGSEDRGAILGEPCTGDERACTIASPHLVLKCVQGAWVEDETCPSSQACVPENSENEQATCVNITGPCGDSYTNFCDEGNYLIDCESFRPDSYMRYCPFGCQDGACLPGTGDQLIVHTGSDRSGWLAPPTIPVCVLDANTSDEALVAWIRDEVERTWARTNNSNFEGWGACNPTLPDAGVVLSFESECRGHLVNDIDRASKFVRLEICRSFYLEGAEPGADPQVVEEPLARFLGRHHFGHVIGVLDSNYQGAQRTAMARGIELSRITEYGISPAELLLANDDCAPGCRKHPRALVTTRGRCLEVVDGSIVARTCAAHGESRPQDFTLRASELFTADAAQCVGVSQAGQATVLAGECSPEIAQFSLTGAALRSLGRCVTPARLPAAPGTALFIGACDAVPESWTGWSFEVTAENDNRLLAHIRHDDLCVSVPGAVAASSLVLELRPCGGGDGQTFDEQTFELRHNGEIGFGEVEEQRCFNWDTFEGSVFLYSKCGYGFNDRWTVTGALTTASGLALTLGDGDGPATATKLDGTPSDAQTFDFYF